MATMDLLHLLGGRPANFLDVGAGASGPQIGKALRMLLTDGDVKGVLVNIFGGMIRCDLIAQSLVEILGQHRPCVPIVVRLVGNAAEKGYEILRDAPVPLEIAMHLEEAAHKIVRAVQPPSNPQGEM
jgi:succinyl-CoA synthetase beta subunit